MSFGIGYEQLTPVSGDVRAGIVSYNGDNPEHRAILREALPRFLGSLGAVHGEAFPKHHLDAVIDVIHSKEIEVDFFLVALDLCCPVLIGGLATGAPTFGAEPDENNNLRIFPVKHGEDLSVDKHIAKLFRENTRNQQNPNGIGAGTWFMGEQIKRSTLNDHWSFAGRDNEHSPENPAIIGLMDKFGSVRGTERDSAVLQLNGLTDAMIAVNWRLRVPVETESLPSHTNGLGLCTNNFLTRWHSEDNKQQVMVVYTKMASTFDGQPVVWTKIKSNGNLPRKEILTQVLSSLLSAGSSEISNRKWGTPRNLIIEGRGQGFYALSPAPVMHIHLNNEKEILDSLLHIGAAYRKFGNHTMLSGIINPRKAPDHIAIFGQKLPEATQVRSVDPECIYEAPCFDVAPQEEKLHSKVIPIRPLTGSTSKYNIWSIVAA